MLETPVTEEIARAAGMVATAETQATAVTSRNLTTVVRTRQQQVQQQQQKEQQETPEPMETPVAEVMLKTVGRLKTAVTPQPQQSHS
jgi:nucleoside recognition membrane protein YjiH